MTRVLFVIRYITCGTPAEGQPRRPMQLQLLRDGNLRLSEIQYVR